ncbi:MAG TPA: hypothetical protein VJ805_08585 [Nitrospiraceae bacterium]|nr:hypothetical protein [Nitrospiraceae bacterium]
MRTLTGRYRCPELGSMTFSETSPDRFLIDVEAWSSHAVVWTDRDGTRSLMLSDAPYAGLIQFLVTGTTARPSLQLEVGQVRYRFVRE